MTREVPALSRTLVLLLCGLLLVGAVPAMGAFAQSDTQTTAEPNDDRTHATPVESGAAVSDELAGNESHWYAVNVSAGDAILTSLELDANQNDTDVEPTDSNHPALEVSIVAPDGETVGFQPSGEATNARVAGYRDAAGAGVGNEGDEWTEPGRNAAVAAENGTYYVRVTEAPEDETAADTATGYNLTVEVDDGITVDPNEGPDAATSVQPGDSVVGDVHPYDAEWFAVELDAGERVTGTVDLTNTNYAEDDERARHWDGDAFLTQLTVRNASGGVVAESDGAYTGADAVNYTASESGTYYVVLESAGESQVFPRKGYELTVTAADAPEDVSDSDGASDGEEPCPN